MFETYMYSWKTQKKIIPIILDKIVKSVRTFPINYKSIPLLQIQYLILFFSDVD